MDDPRVSCNVRCDNGECRPCIYQGPHSRTRNRLTILLILSDYCERGADFHLQERSCLSQDNRRAQGYFDFLAILDSLAFSAIDYAVDQNRASMTKLTGLSLVTW